MPDVDGVDLISQLYRVLSSSLVALEKTPIYFETVINRDLWQRQVLPNGMVVEFDCFRDFIETQPPRGFGIPLGKLQEIFRLHPDILARINDLTSDDSNCPEDEQVILHNRRRLRRRITDLLKDFSRNEVLQEMRSMGLMTGPR